MEYLSKHRNKLLIAALTIIVISSQLYILKMANDSFSNDPVPKRDTADVLTEYLPPKVGSLTLIDQTYDPRSNCFDKCGQLSQQNSFTEWAAVCDELMAAVASDTRDVRLKLESGTADFVVDTAATCGSLKSDKPTVNLNFEMNLPKDNPPYKAGYYSVATVSVNFTEKTMKYTVTDGIQRRFTE